MGDTFASMANSLFLLLELSPPLPHLHTHILPFVAWQQGVTVRKIGILLAGEQQGWLRKGWCSAAPGHQGKGSNPREQTLYQTHSAVTLMVTEENSSHC